MNSNQALSLTCSEVYGHCNSCGGTKPLAFTDQSFDYGASHAGPAGTQKVTSWNCEECDAECTPYCVPDKDEYDPEFDG